MSRERSSLYRRVRGALALGAFGALITGPMEFFDSGSGQDVALALLVGATAGVIVGFLISRAAAAPPRAAANYTTASSATTTTRAQIGI
ncbi:hypothetical protein RKD32_007388 [Streptomyces sp. SAI-195]|uniref:hypothetical protein n=1 Tax=unclassified Streptomyces TaxID=2593676 RepID=UPI0034194D3D